MDKDIAQLRSDIITHFDSEGMIENSKEISFSEDKLYYYTSTEYRQKNTHSNWIVSKIEVWKREASEKIFEYITDNDRSHQVSLWMKTNDGREYLFMPEFQTGYSVFDVSSGQLHSSEQKEDPFIWTQIFPSLDKTKLAVFGCYWACPFGIKIYDIKDITRLPYPIIHEIYPPNDHEFLDVVWIDNGSFKINTKTKETIIKL